MKRLKLLYISLILLLSVCKVYAEGDTLSNDTLSCGFLQSGTYFDPLYLDPMEAQLFISFNPLYLHNNKRYGNVYMPFSLGLFKSVYRWKKSELGFDVLVNTQFIWKNDKKNINRRYMISGDYKVGIVYNYIINENIKIRTRLWHTSVHEANDYIYEKRLTTWTADPVNYEQLDITAMYKFRIARFYCGPGVVVRPDSPLRKRFSMQAGTMVDLKSEKKVSFICGFDAKMLQQFEYRPNIKIGAGCRIGIKKRSLRLIVEYYNGYTPYTRFEKNKAEWLGIGLYL